MIAALLAAALLSSPTLAGASQQPASPEIAPVDLEEVVVEGNRLETTTEIFVREVGAPSRDRGLARWRGAICTEIVNLQPELAQVVAERVSSTARDLGLRTGAPGCEPTILVVATVDAAEFTTAFVERRPTLFRVGGAGMDRGSRALNAFQSSNKAVRWWQVSAPVTETGEIAVRIPGYCANSCANASDMAPSVKVLASSLWAPTEDDIKKVYVIIDVDKVSGVSIEQLSDYITMVSLAQIDPDADTRGYSTILNLFDDPQNTPRLTTWDRAYLTGLYGAQRSLRNTRAARSEVVGSIVRARRAMDARRGDDAGR